MSNWKGHCKDLMEYMKSKWQWCEEQMKDHENELRYESLKEQYECEQTKDVDWKGVTKQAIPRAGGDGNCEGVVAQFVNKQRLSEQELATCRRVVMLWRWLDTTHGIHTLHDVFESKRQLCLITSALEGGDLFHYITSDSIRPLWNEVAIATLFAQVCLFVCLFVCLLKKKK
ncbi:hypothetical protein RFI_09714 [Reticulomyxa filosa]|uniref:Uncharacterized protein n=1 Tax=Reticulomyxa filosa TaxID=46433 RepID=X6NP15_RETFI|nr:hypothetical protein RFI_09714 [Reticulomyxa filosa]|eukprot:ETO27419.1 hypothetical protein RFI_09714 [Reticulomyxa filosa]